MQRIILAIAIACASVSLCGCNLSSQPYEAAPVAAAPPLGARAKLAAAAAKRALRGKAQQLSEGFDRRRQDRQRRPLRL